jgi:hypothetical protein
MIYPKEEFGDMWIRGMELMIKMKFMSEEEMNNCIKEGGMPEKLIEKVRLRMEIHIKTHN